MTKTIGSLLALGALLLACGAEPEGTAAAPQMLQDASEAEAAASDRLDPQLRLAAEQAIQLWNDAAGGREIPLPARIELVDFGADTEHGGGWVASRDTIVISTLVPQEQLVSVIAHELGHSLGLEHAPGTGELMDPDRPHAVRLLPCVSAADVAAAGLVGSGACFE